jgi:PTH1 family peptidyl-tRNA hydrolase
VKIIVGLGNPGKKFEKTRHNIGFRVIDALLNSDLYKPVAKRVFLLQEKNIALISEGSVFDEKVFLVKPQTYMNNTGGAIEGLKNNFSGIMDDFLFVSDDFNLPFGILRFRRQGSSGGHKGLQSIIDQIGHTRFPRLRIGIGLPDDNDPTMFVLEKFSIQEENELKYVLNRAVESIFFYLKQGIEIAMNKYN